ncbi:MAG: aminotransferase class I/II-fold pyridoxal phosphate-dependent enzyme [Eubacteriales bacterium]|nr:aminotransferase class I/II-fold pyridoxal phosphate-dependent enzyme [Eubacteriales bacterium]
MSERLYFCSDYMEGAHPAIMNRLIETNMEKTGGYGFDTYCDSAKERIRQACQCPEAEVHFLVGGTQTNATVISCLLRGYQGVIAAETGHIATHEAGAIEAGGHKVMTIPHELGKINAEDVACLLGDFHSDDNRDHMVMPGMVYISQPTEYGTLYTLEEVEALSAVCRQYQIPLYVDGARMAYALATPSNDLTLADLARLCDVFYIGGTKCGALFGEAVVIPKKDTIPHFFTLIKQHGALLAKGRILGIQFDELFRDDLYLHIGDTAIELAQMLQKEIKDMGYQLFYESPTNQIFFVFENEELARLGEKVEYSFWEKYDDNHTAIRFATSWATSKEDADKLLAILRK